MVKWFEAGLVPPTYPGMIPATSYLFSLLGHGRKQMEPVTIKLHDLASPSRNKIVSSLPWAYVVKEQGMRIKTIFLCEFNPKMKFGKANGNQ